MAVRCPNCGAEYDVTLFTFDRRLHCDCGVWVDLAVGHQQAIEAGKHMTTHTPTIVLCLPPKTEESEEFGLPSDSDNIFQRLIRNPRLESETPRERECTEMLCSVLRNSRPLRQHLLRWLGTQIGNVPPNFDDLDFRIETEQAIGSKRDDLRIEGWKEVGDDQTLVVLWTVEVKVGADFHLSSLQGESAGEEETIDQGDLVNQLLNYDAWLRAQPAECRAGFVLALRSMAATVPQGLSMPWRCLTWTQVGQQLREVLKQTKLLPVDELLCKHLLGFIQRHLWRAADMSNDQLGFDDIALIRAFSHLGVDCDKKIARLVGQLTNALEQAGIGSGKITQQNVIFRPTRRTVVYRLIFEKEFSECPWIMLGVERDHLVVFLETPPTHAKKRKVYEALMSVAPKLTAIDPRWEIFSLEERMGKDLEIRSPLLDLLVAADQDAMFLSFFRRALDGLKEAGVIEAVRASIGS